MSACSESLVEGGHPHTAELTVDRTSAAVGDSIVFTVEGSGQLLAGLAIEFGDGEADTLAAEGAVIGALTRKHAYEEAGTYQAVGTVADGTNLGVVELKDTVTIQITGGG